MPRSANTLSALKSVPGPFGSVKTMVVLSGLSGEIGRQLDFTDKRQLVLGEGIEVAVDAAANRVLDRQHAVAGGSAFHRVEDVLEAPAGHQQRLRVDLERRCLAERPRLTLIRNSHMVPETKRAIIPYRMMALGFASPVACPSSCRVVSPEDDTNQGTSHDP